MNDYPTDETLERIKTWLPVDGFDALMKFIEANWNYADCGYWTGPVPYKWLIEEGNQYSISTVGWSGNESIIDAMQNNWMFWCTCWYSSQRGGHYIFRVPSHFFKKEETNAT